MGTPDRDKPLEPGLARAANEMLGDLRQGEVIPDAPTVAAPLPDSATPPTSRADTGFLWRSRVPRSLGPYDLLEELGHGGMGVVYRARHANLGTIRAVKVLIAGEHASLESIVRFQREAAAVARMGKHPNIVSVHDLGEERGIAWYAMEFVEGKSLRDRLREKEYAPAEAARLMEKVARALHFAHGHGIVHRDVKPENVVVRQDGEPEVMDFGLARDVDSNAKISVAGAAMGTPNYMAPEQVEGKHQECDARTDVYAVGATLYEVLTGAFAHPGHAVAQVFEHIRRGDVVPPRRLRPDVPRDLETICLKCLAPERARRYATAEALANDLARFVSGEPILARRVGLLERAWKRVRRNRAVSALAVALLLTVVAAVLWKPVSDLLAERRKEEERAARLASDQRRVEEARTALDRGKPDEARQRAKNVIEDYGRDGLGYAHTPLVEAHALLASIARREGDHQRALLEAFRASRAAPDTGLEEKCRLDLACLVFGTGEFELASQRIASAHAQEGLVVGPDEVDVVKRLAAILASRMEVPILPRVFCAGDVDGDGRDEILSIGADGAEVQVLSYDRGRFEVLASFPVPAEIRGTARGLDVMEIDGEGPPEILLAGQSGSLDRGLIRVLRWKNGQIHLVAEGILPGGTMDRPFASADLDRDGSHELLVGLGAGTHRGIAVFSVNEASRRLDDVMFAEAQGDVWELFPQERGERTEILAFLGGWHAYQACVLRFDLGRKEATVEAAIPFAKEVRLERRLAELKRGPLLIGAKWSDDASRPLREEKGKVAFASYRPPGIYEAPASASSAADVHPVIQQKEIPLAGEIDARPCRLWDKEGDFCWSMVTRAVDGNPRMEIRIHELRGGKWSEVVGYEAGQVCTMSPGSADVDGDGDSELFLRFATTFQVIGAKREPGVPEKRDEIDSKRASASWTSRALRDAQEAEALGLPDEAIRWYRVALEGEGTLEEASLGSQGFLRTQTAEGRLAEASKHILERIEQTPTLRAPLAMPLLDAAEAAGEWRTALAAADALAIASGLSQVERSALAVRRDRLAALVNPRVAARFGRAGEPFPMLASSPLCARIGADGAILFTWRAYGSDAIFFPLDYDKVGYRLTGQVQLDRLDWGANLELGVVQGDPWAYSAEGWGEPHAGAPLARPSAEHVLHFDAFGETWSPSRVLDLLSREMHTHGSQRMRSRIALTPEEPEGISWTLEFPSHLDVLYARLEGPSGHGVWRVPGAHLTDARPYVRISGYGGVEKQESWGRARIADLTLFTAGGTTGTYEPKPRSAAELLFLANGLWIQGQKAEARTLYDQAIAAGDAWEAGEAALVAAGLPSTSRAGWTEGAIRWVPVDARFWRGLLIAESDGVAAALSDLIEARCRSLDRVAWLIRRSALMLDDPSAREALRALLAPNTTDWKLAGEGLVKDWGANVAKALLADVAFDVRSRCQVAAPHEPALPGDVLVSINGVLVDHPGTGRRLLSAALDEGKTSVPIVLERSGIEIPTHVDPREGPFKLDLVHQVVPVRER